MIKSLFGLFIGNGMFKLNKGDVISIGKGAGVASVGAGLIYVISGLSGLDFGVWTPAAGAVASIIMNIIRKWVADNTKSA